MAGYSEFGQGAPGGFGTLGSRAAAPNPGRDGMTAAIMANMYPQPQTFPPQQQQLPGMGPPGATAPGVTPGTQPLGQSPLGMGAPPLGAPGTPAPMPGGGQLPSLLPQQPLQQMAPPAMPGARPY